MSSLPTYSAGCLKIRTKSGRVTAFALNRAQWHVHEELERQKAQTGRVRALILKGRQQGCSTYVGARFYHQTTHRRGVRTFILTHEDGATQNLFEMVNRFHEHLPDIIKPETIAANAKELKFGELDSGYKVGTAGTKGVGRSGTLQLFHGSEVAFWPHAETHAAGVLQSILDIAGTEIILESTANGVGNYFHTEWRKAEKSIGDYIAIFVPWFWQEEYRRAVPSGFRLDEEENSYMETFGLTLPQMAWRRAKIIELKDPLLFKQEYPANAAEAFQMSGHDSFIAPELILRARKFVTDGIGALVLGVDPARFGDDRFAIAWRRGRKVEKVESRAKLDTVAGANWIKQIIDRQKPKRVFVDVGGSGAGVYDLLVSWGYGEEHEKPVRAVNFGGEPVLPPDVDSDGNLIPGPRNRRAEMWAQSKAWLSDVAGADIPDSDSIQADACGPGYHYDTNQRLLLESKEHMRARGVSSPDEWDAIALTFAEPVAPDRPVRKDRTRLQSAWAV